MSRALWTVERLKEAAAPFSTRQQFVKGHPTAYSAAAKRKLLDVVCAHMAAPSNLKVPDETIHEIAKQFQHSSDFRAAYPSYYQAAHSRGILQSVQAHMTEKGYKSTHAEYVEYFNNKWSDKFTLLSEYKSSKEKITVHCKSCSNEWETIPFRIRCKTCGQAKVSETLSKTHKQYVAELTSTITVCEPYKGSQIAIEHSCKCGHIWKAKPMNVLGTKFGCPACAREKQTYRSADTHEQYVAKLNGKIYPLEPYAGVNAVIKHKCLQCDYEWTVKPKVILRGHGCPKRCTPMADFIPELTSRFDGKITLMSKFVNVSTKSTFKCEKGHQFETMPKDMLRMLGCPDCQGHGTSNREKELAEYVSSLGFEVVTNTRSVIPPKELDIYVPEKKTAIEFNGAYWYSRHPVNYHLEKTQECEKLGIHLIHVWEHERNSPVIKSIISNALGYNHYVYFGRDCSVIDLEWSATKKFLNENHIQGCGAPTPINKALTHDGKIIAVMTFAKPRFQPVTTEWELVRYAVAKETRIVGGANKLWSKRPGGSVVSYSDRRLFSGKLYERLGFTKEHVNQPSYFYVNSTGETLSRYQTQRKSLSKLLGPMFNAEMSEAENMNRAGWVKMYDCGSIRWVWRT